MSSTSHCVAAWKIVAIKHLFETSHQGGSAVLLAQFPSFLCYRGWSDGSMNVPSSCCSLGQQSGLPANTIDIGHIEVFGVLSWR